MNVGYILTGIIIIAGAIYFLYPRYEQFYRFRPNLVVELEPNKGITKNQTYMGPTTKNEGPIIEAGDPNTWFLYKFEWHFDLVVRNNSEYNAYNTRLLQHNTRPQIQFRGKINFQKALRSQEEIVLPFTIHSYEECQAKDREKIFASDPEFLNDLMIVFDYSNPKGRHFQSRYYFNTNRTDFKRIPRSELNKHWNSTF